MQAAELAERYDAVIYAVGAQSDRPLDIPGEDLPGSVPPSTSSAGTTPTRTSRRWRRICRRCARRRRRQRQRRAGRGADPGHRSRSCWPPPTSPTTRCESLHDRGVEEVVIVGRRGPLQATFTTLELRELGDLEAHGDVDVVVDPADFADITDEDLDAAGKTVKQNIKVLRGYSDTSAEGRQTPHRVPVPHLARSRSRATTRSSRIVLGRNELVTTTNGRVVAKDTGEREEVPAQLVVRAVGYRGVAHAGPAVRRAQRHDSAHRRPHRGQPQRIRRRLDQARAHPASSAATRRTPQETVDTLIADLAAASLADFEAEHADRLAEWLVSRQPELVTDEHWKLIDEHERTSGESHGRPRVKLTSVAELLRIGHG